MIVKSDKKINISARLFFVLIGCFPLILAFLLRIGIYFTGFPDGYVTDYERVVMPLDYILIYASLIFFIFLQYKIFKMKEKKDFKMATLLLLAYIIIFFIIKFGLYFYLINYSRLDDGVGG